MNTKFFNLLISAIPIIFLVVIFSCSGSKNLSQHTYSQDTVYICVNFHKDMPEYLQSEVYSKLDFMVSHHNSKNRQFPISKCNHKNENYRTYKATFGLRKYVKPHNAALSIVVSAATVVFFPPGFFMFFHPKSKSNMIVEMSDNLPDDENQYFTVKNMSLFGSKKRQDGNHADAIINVLLHQLNRMSGRYEKQQQNAV